jgi:hypothetical protein
LTRRGRPSRFAPFIVSIAFCASAGVPIVTKPKPRDWPEVRSVTICTSVTSPMRANASRTVSLVDENDRLPTYRRVPMSLSSSVAAFVTARRTQGGTGRGPGACRPINRGIGRQAAAAESVASTRCVAVERDPRSHGSRESVLAGETSVSHTKITEPSRGASLRVFARNTPDDSAEKRERRGRPEARRDAVLGGAAVLRPDPPCLGKRLGEVRQLRRGLEHFNLGRGYHPTHRLTDHVRNDRLEDVVSPGDFHLRPDRR